MSRALPSPPIFAAGRGARGRRRKLRGRPQERRRSRAPASGGTAASPISSPSNRYPTSRDPRSVGQLLRGLAQRALRIAYEEPTRLGSRLLLSPEIVERGSDHEVTIFCELSVRKTCLVFARELERVGRTSTEERGACAFDEGSFVGERVDWTHRRRRRRNRARVRGTRRRDDPWWARRRGYRDRRARNGGRVGCCRRDDARAGRGRDRLNDRHLLPRGQQSSGHHTCSERDEESRSERIEATLSGRKGRRLEGRKQRAGEETDGRDAEARPPRARGSEGRHGPENGQEVREAREAAERAREEAELPDAGRSVLAGGLVRRDGEARGRARARGEGAVRVASRATA